MPSRASTSFLLWVFLIFVVVGAIVCQCPHGLVPHFYMDGGIRRIQIRILRVNALTGQYLISTWENPGVIGWENEEVSMPSRASTSFLQDAFRYSHFEDTHCVNALTGQYLISTVPLQKPRFYAVSRACFFRYLSEYSDNSCFSCMLTIWTYLTRYICL